MVNQEQFAATDEGRLVLDRFNLGDILGAFRFNIKNFSGSDLKFLILLWFFRLVAASTPYFNLSLRNDCETKSIKICCDSCAVSNLDLSS